MPPFDSVLAFTVAAFVLIIVPGPSVLFVVSRGVALGRRAALLSVLGNAAGCLVHVVAVAVGLGAVVERSAAVFTVAQAGRRGLPRVPRRPGDPPRRCAGGGARRRRRCPQRSRRLLGEGFVVGVANPKAIIFLAAILPQFVDRDGGPRRACRCSCSGMIFLAARAGLRQLLGDGRRLGPQRARLLAARGWSGWARPAAW